ncbi:MAG: hypothetical protein WAM28_04520 [Chlamydiales bacterium]
MKDNKFIQFLLKHRSKALLTFLAFACVIAWGKRLIGKNKAHHKHDFIVVSQIFDRFYSGEPLSNESIEATENVLKRHPELYPKYAPMLAATFFAQQKSSKARPYAESTIDHVKDNLPPFYRDYAKTSLLITEEMYEQAFIQAQQLNTELKNQTEDYNTLYLMNLVRLVFLADKLNRQESKKEAWQQLQQQPGYASIKPLFQEGQLSLTDYLK